MGCADHRLCGVCHPHRPRRNVLHGAQLGMKSEK
jgi:hypothetical protein